MEYISKKYLLEAYEKARKQDAISFKKLIEEAPTIDLPTKEDIAATFNYLMEDDYKEHSGLLTED